MSDVNDNQPSYLSRPENLCPHVSVVPEKRYEDIAEDRVAVLQEAEQQLAAMFGEAWCHVDDPDPFLRIYANDSNQHHTVGEWIKTEKVFNDFRWATPIPDIPF